MSDDMVDDVDPTDPDRAEAQAAAEAILASLLDGVGGGGGEGDSGDDTTLTPAVDVESLTAGELRDLWGWGEQVRARWRCGATIPACWITHHAMAAEMLGLMLAWDEVLGGQSTLAGWCQQLDLALGRIERRWSASCGAGHHMPDPEVATDDTWLQQRISAAG